ncbi:hypothetical protein CAPTEDRAFT_224076 [Capitella teleta]|uniref:Mediator of RNA polymerase II transcription subunit 1 n=1 Tax=Capitella teleta TaxID=283909 RepID=R7U120_CAPTE|nr:hypothetical protein CAPTEDRAFT_224076 [Capitella teleta]|eukprot:ELT99582.1 hypothetical protein CAPTEDRAFT_224076 [Capitella teleta]
MAAQSTQLVQLMERLRNRRPPSWNDTLRCLKSALVEKRPFAVDKSKLRCHLETLHKAFKVTDYTSMVERLELLAHRHGLKFSHDPNTAVIYLSADVLYLQVALEASGRVKMVQVSCNSEITNCPDLAKSLSNSQFESFIKHIDGLSSVSNVCTDKKLKSKLFLALQSLETDLSMLSKLQSTISSVPNYIHKSPLGILLPRNGGIAMRMVYFVGPYDLLNESTASSCPMTVEGIVDNNIGCSVTVGVESSELHKLQTMPLMSINHSPEGKSMPAFSALSSVNSCHFPAVFVLRLQKPIPVSLTVLRLIQEVTDLEVVDPSEMTSLPSLLLQHYSKHRAAEYDSTKGLHVPLPDQRHSYFLSALNGSPDLQGALVTRIPFLHPTNVPRLLQLLRMQLLFNTVIGSCISKQPLKSAELDLRDITNVRCVINPHDNQEPICPEEHASRVFQRCLSIPITMRSVLHKAKHLLKAELLRQTPPPPLPVATPPLSRTGLERRLAFIESHAPPSKMAEYNQDAMDALEGIDPVPVTPTTPLAATSSPNKMCFDKVVKNPMLASLLDQESSASPSVVSRDSQSSAPMLSALLGNDSPSSTSSNFSTSTTSTMATINKHRKQRKRRSNSERTSPVNRTPKRKPSEDDFSSSLPPMDFDFTGFDLPPSAPPSATLTPTLTTPTVNLSAEEQRANPFLQESHVSRLASSLDKIIKQESKDGEIQPECSTHAEDGRKEGGGLNHVGVEGGGGGDDVVKLETVAEAFQELSAKSFNPTDLINKTAKLHRQRSHDKDLYDFHVIKTETNYFNDNEDSQKSFTKEKQPEGTTIKIKMDVGHGVSIAMSKEKKERADTKPPITVKLNKKILKDSPLMKSEGGLDASSWQPEKKNHGTVDLTKSEDASPRILTGSLKSKRFTKEKLREKKKRSSKHNSSDRDKRKRNDEIKREELKKQKIYDFDSEINRSENFRVEKGPQKPTTIKITKVPSAASRGALVTTSVSNKSPSRTSPVVSSPSQVKVVKGVDGGREKGLSKVTSRPGQKQVYNRSKSDPQGAWGVSANASASSGSANGGSSKVDSKLTRNPSVKLKPLNLAPGGTTVTVSMPNKNSQSPISTPSTPRTAPVAPSSSKALPPPRKKGSLSAVIDKLTKQQKGPTDRKEAYDAIRLQIIREGNKPSTPTKELLEGSFKSSQGKKPGSLSGMKTIPKVPKTSSSTPSHLQNKTAQIPGRRSPSVNAKPAQAPSNNSQKPALNSIPSAIPSKAVPPTSRPNTASPKGDPSSRPKDILLSKNQPIQSPPQTELPSPSRASVPTIPLVKQTSKAQATPPPVMHSRDPRTLGPSKVPPKPSASAVTFTESPASPTPENRGPSKQEDKAKAAAAAAAAKGEDAPNRHFLDAVIKLNGTSEECEEKKTSVQPQNHVKSADDNRSKHPSLQTSAQTPKSVNSSEDKENKAAKSAADDDVFKAPTPKTAAWNGEEAERSRVDKFRSKSVLSPRSDISSPEDGLIIDVHSPATPRDPTARLRERSNSPKSPAIRSPMSADLPKSPANHLALSPSPRRPIRQGPSPQTLKPVRGSPSKSSPAVGDALDIDDDLMDAALGVV